ncbi:NHL repeat-containing protein [Variovorax sp. GB1P17]|uniref:NHL repeat-containing protein n=1 Tax=Variovorax sp. GB1P17 TaxID=3443740 RepID=UPI003F459633
MPQAADGSFRFATSLAGGAAYVVTVKVQPSKPTQTCTVNNAGGTVASADVSNVKVICATNSYSVGGKVTGLAGSGLVLQNNSADDLPVAANGSFSFPQPVASGAAYAVTVKTQPTAPAQTCSVNPASGTVGTNAVSDLAVACSAPQAQVSTLAGSGARGSVNNTGTDASFNLPKGAAVDASGNVYVAEFASHLIRKITPAGVVSTLAGSGAAGSDNGTGTAASFNFPGGVAVDASANVYVADTSNHLIRKITPAGAVSTLAGSGDRGSVDDTGTAASFAFPQGVTVDASGNVYVADSSNHLIRMITPAGVVSTLAGSGAGGLANGTGTAASFNLPSGVAVDASGNVYATDWGNGMIRKITPARVVSTLAGSGAVGSNNGTGTAASFFVPQGVAVDASGNLYVVDQYNQLIRKITSTGVVSTLAGLVGVEGSANGAATAASFKYPTGVAVDASGNVYVADTNNNLIRKITPAPGS